MKKLLLLLIFFSCEKEPIATECVPTAIVTNENSIDIYSGTLVNFFTSNIWSSDEIYIITLDSDDCYLGKYQIKFIN